MLRRRKLSAFAASLVACGFLSTMTAPSAQAAGTITYTYSVATRGIIRSDVGYFAAHAQATFDDQRGWGLGGAIRFVRVSSGGSFTLWLAAANQLPSFGYPCSSTYSCRVGRDVIINDDRWSYGSPYLAMGLNDYRDLVVNHETGHWLGFGHRTCAGTGQAAYVMQQQSKGGTYLGGCRPNAWPRAEERNALASSLGVAILPPPPSPPPVDACLARVTTFTAAPTPASVIPSGGPYDPVTPTRVLDTRIGVGAPTGCVGPGRTLDVQVAGRAGVPTSNVGAVAINLTAVSPTGAGYATVSPAGAANPGSSTLNFGPGRTVTNFAMVPLGSSGQITISNVGGYTYYIVDVVGFIPSGSSIVTAPPVRLLDTRAGLGAPTGRIAPGQEVKVLLAGRGGVPSTAQGVVVNLTVVAPSSAGYATVFPSESTRPDASTLNFGASATVANFAVARLGADGQITIFNAGGTADYLIDVLGYVAAGSTFTTSPPTRVLDTRSGLGAAPGRIASGSIVSVQMAGPAGAPPTAGDVVAVNLTAVAPDAAGYASVFGGPAAPGTSNLNFGPGQTVAGFALVKLGADGQLNVRHFGGSADYLVDVAGFIHGP